MQSTASVEEISNSIFDEEEDTLSNKYLTFHIGPEIYGLKVRHIIEIGVIQEITFVPGLPEVIKGVINLRGEVISVMDMRTRFNKDAREYDDRTCIIVVEIRDLKVGLIVDKVREVLDIPEDNIDPPPRTHSGQQSNYIEGMGKINNEVKILLDVNKILYENELAQIN